MSFHSQRNVASPGGRVGFGPPPTDTFMSAGGVSVGGGGGVRGGASGRGAGVGVGVGGVVSVGGDAGVGGGVVGGVGGTGSCGGCVEACGCGAGGCAEGCLVAAGVGVMTKVGPGRGEYIIETNYKFVGAGAGDLSLIAPREILWSRVVCLVITILSLLSLLYLLAHPATTTSTTTMRAVVLPATEPPQLPKPVETEPPPPPHGECTYWGDPHILTFDGGRPSFYGEGELWIVKSDAVWIQGRYRGTQYTKGLAATNKVAVGGPFLKNHVIAVGDLEDGPITVDGQAVLTAFPGTHRIGELATITYNAEGRLVDDATHVWEKHIVHMQLPMGVRVTVLRWNNYVDFRVAMQKQPNQDGGCGNFNGDPQDDSTEQIFARIGARVEHGKLLFRHRVDVRLTAAEEKLLALCPAEKLEAAKKNCPHELGNFQHSTGGILTKSCTLDLCFGSNEHALRLATKLGL